MPNSNQQIMVNQESAKLDLYVEECIRDQNANLIFLSVWGQHHAVNVLLHQCTFNIDDPNLFEPFNLIADQQKFPDFCQSWAKRATFTFGMGGLYV